MTRAVHIVLQGKGGVGKSVVSRLLQEYMIAKGEDYVGFDADPINQTFAAHDNLKVSKVNLLSESGSRIDPLLFDTLLETIVENGDKTIILDTGASTFLPFLEYFSDNDIIAVLTDEGFEVFLHTLVTGGTSALDTVKGFAQLAERFGDSCNVIVWENRHFGKVELEGKPFPEIKSVKGTLDKPGVNRIILDKPKDLHMAAFLDFIQQGESFDEASAKTNTKFQMMARNRLKQLKDEYIALLDPIIGEQADAA